MASKPAFILQAPTGVGASATAGEAAIAVFHKRDKADSAAVAEDSGDVKAAESGRVAPEARAPNVLPKAGIQNTFERLVKTHERRVFRTAWRLLGRLEDAQDAAQEVFLRLFRYHDRVDPDRPLEPWLYRVTVNVCRDLGRRRSVRQAMSLEEAELARPLKSTEPDPGTVASVAEERRIVEQALATLAEKERMALVLRDVEGLSTAEVAEILGSSQTTVRSQISRARLKIKKHRDRHMKRNLR